MRPDQFIPLFAPIVTFVAGIGVGAILANYPFPTYDTEKYYEAFHRCMKDDTHLMDDFCREYARAMSEVKPTKAIVPTSPIPGDVWRTTEMPAGYCLTIEANGHWETTRCQWP